MDWKKYLGRVAVRNRLGEVLIPCASALHPDAEGVILTVRVSEPEKDRRGLFVIAEDDGILAQVISQRPTETQGAWRGDGSSAPSWYGSSGRDIRSWHVALPDGREARLIYFHGFFRIENAEDLGIEPQRVSGLVLREW